MTDGGRTVDANSVDQAINQVLAVEREARERLADCRSEAAGILAAAEERAHRIAERNQERMDIVHRIAERSLKRKLDALRGSQAAHGPKALRGYLATGGSTPCEKGVPEALDRALDDLLEEMFGTGP